MNDRLAMEILFSKLSFYSLWSITLHCYTFNVSHYQHINTHCNLYRLSNISKFMRWSIYLASNLNSNTKITNITIIYYLYKFNIYVNKINCCEFVERIDGFGWNSFWFYVLFFNFQKYKITLFCFLHSTLIDLLNSVNLFIVKLIQIVHIQQLIV